MTKIAAAGQLPSSNALHFGGGAGGKGGSMTSTASLKRKTPSELRGELLKRKNSVEIVDESPVPDITFIRNVDGAYSVSKISDPSKEPRYTRMDKLYPITKTSRLLPTKENFKHWQETVPSKCVGSLANSSLPMDFTAKLPVKNSCPDDTIASECGSVYSNQAHKSDDKCSTCTFKSIRELSLGSEKLNGSSSVDMDKALKGLVSCEPRTASASLAESTDRPVNLMQDSFSSELLLPGYKIPLDLSLKTNMRLLSSSTVDWFHRLMNCGTSNFMALLTLASVPSPSLTCSSEPTFTNKITSHGTFHSWVYPQSTLPHAAISALTSLPGQMDFLNKRQQAWEDSFRSLYYMFRKKFCHIFYVCTEQFVVLFTASDSSKETKRSCYAYVSKSTRNLRMLLKEHDVSFSMPLCHSILEEVTAEDLVELSEIEKHEIGQTRPTETMTGVDNSPQSLLMFTGNRNVHALYDFLLNYRISLASLTGGDVPLLYSPVPFENAALSAPEVRCKQLRRIDYISSQLKDSNTDGEPNVDSSAGICFSVEVRDSHLPPWVVCGICDAMRSNAGDFQASFVTESASISLNAGLNLSTDRPAQQAKAEEPLPEIGRPFGIPNATLSLQRHSAFLKGLKYCSGSYTAFLSPVE